MTMETMGKHYKLINNAPCSKDLFEGKAHTIIAENICKAIKEDESCHMIGLDGGWGSGKSNLLKLVEQQFTEEQNHKTKYHFFTYDAWGHQEDIQRRAILEDVTSFIANESSPLVKNHNDWKEKLDDLLAKNRITKFKTIPKLSVGVILGVLTMIIAPVFTPLAEIFGKKYGWLIYLIPPLIFIMFLIYYWIQKKVFKDALNEVLSFYHKDRVDTETTEKISESVPSSKEFKDWMRNISNDLEVHNKLILIFDNMDRLPSNKVQDLWSSIHSFFSEETYPNIWVIIPFDRNHIRNAFKNEDIGYNEQDNKNNISYGDDFINKTFDIVYRVSPPTLVGWKQYFRNLWETVFDDVDSDNFEGITQIYDLLSTEQSPRRIIAFINEFITIKQISGEFVPGRYIALYIFGRDKIYSNGLQEFFSPTFLGAIDFLYKDDKELPKYLAAIHYQLPPEQVTDIIFTDRLKKALDNKDSNTLESISKHAQFPDILENAIVQISNIPNAIECFDEVFKQTPKHNYIKQMWRSLYRKAKNLTREELQKFQIILLENIENPEEYLRQILSDFVNNDTFNAQRYFNDIERLKELENLDIFECLESKELEVEQFVELVKLAKENIDKYKVSCNNPKLEEYLVPLVPDKLQSITFIPYIKEKYSLKKYVSKIKEVIPSKVNDKNSIAILYTRLKELEKPIEISYLSDSEIYTLFNSTNENENFYYDLICMRIAKFDNFNSSYRSYFDNELNSQDDKLIEKIAERIEYYTTYGDILLNLSTMDYKWYKEIAKKLTEKSYEGSRLDILSILQDYNSIIENLKEYIDKATLINRLDGWSDYVKEKVTTDNISSIPLKFFEDIHQMESNKLIEHCTTVTHNYLKQIAKEEWVKTIENQDFAYEVMKVMDFPIPQKAFEALQDIIFVFISEEQDYEEQIQYLLSKSQKEDKVLAPMFKDIRDKFTRGDVEMNTDIFNVLGKYLLEYGKLEEKEESLRTILNNEITDNFTDLLLNYTTIIRNIIQKAGKEASNFTDHIKEQAKSNNAMEQLAKQLGIIIQKDKDASNKNTEKQ